MAKKHHDGGQFDLFTPYISDLPLRRDKLIGKNLYQNSTPNRCTVHILLMTTEKFARAGHQKQGLGDDDALQTPFQLFAYQI